MKRERKARRDAIEIFIDGMNYWFKRWFFCCKSYEMRKCQTGRWHVHARRCGICPRNGTSQNLLDVHTTRPHLISALYAMRRKDEKRAECAKLKVLNHRRAQSGADFKKFVRNCAVNEVKDDATWFTPTRREQTEKSRRTFEPSLNLCTFYWLPNIF